MLHEQYTKSRLERAKAKKKRLLCTTKSQNILLWHAQITRLSRLLCCESTPGKAVEFKYLCADACGLI